MVAAAAAARRWCRRVRMGGGVWCPKADEPWHLHCCGVEVHVTQAVGGAPLATGPHACRLAFFLEGVWGPGLMFPLCMAVRHNTLIIHICIHRC